MPQIREYRSRSEVAGPIQTRKISGEDLGSGRALEQLGQTVQNVGDFVYKRAEQSELADTTAALSKAHLELTRELQDETQKGTINTESFMEKLDKKMEDAGSGLFTNGAREYFQKNSAALKQHFFQSSFQSQAEVAGSKAKADYQESLNNWSGALMNDPSSYNVTKLQHDEYVDSLVKGGTLPYSVAQQLKTQGGSKLAEGAMRGWIQVNPEDAKTRLDNGEFNKSFDEDVKKQLYGEADMKIRARDADSERTKKLQKEASEEKQKATMLDFVQRMYTKGDVSNQEIANSNLDPKEMEHFFKLNQEETKQRSETDWNVFNSVYQRINLPEGDPHKINDEREIVALGGGGGLALPQVNQLLDVFQGSNTQEGKDTAQLRKAVTEYAEAKLVKKNPMGGIIDPEGPQLYASWLAQFQSDLADGRKKGIPIKRLLTPGTEDYVGSSVNNFVRSPKDVMKTLINRNRTTPENTISEETKRKPGESIDAWKKRTQK